MNIVKLIKNKIREFSKGLIQREDGFNMLEMVIVIAIIGIIIALVGPNVVKNLDKAKTTAAQSQIKNFETVLTQYNMDNGNYPTSEQGLAALITPATSDPAPTNFADGGYMKKLPQDPWKHDYVYTSPGENGEDFVIISYGADGQPGGTGKNADISSKD